MPGGAAAAVSCAICGRTLLVGEDTTRFSPDGVEYLDVCPLCRGHAMEAGWYREGDTSLPVMAAAPRRGFFARLMGTPQASSPPVAQPILSRLSPDDQAIVEAVALFNGSSHRRTIEGLMRSLGTPRAIVLPMETGDTGIMATAFVDVGVDLLFFQQQPHAIGELQFAAGTSGRFFQHVKDSRR